MEHRAYKADVGMALKTQMGDLAALVECKAEQADLVVRRAWTALLLVDKRLSTGQAWNSVLRALNTV